MYVRQLILDHACQLLEGSVLWTHRDVFTMLQSSRNQARQHELEFAHVHAS